MAKHQYIVAIGASAGGLQALTDFFEHTPLDSVSYVIIPHLSPDFKSQMAEILSRHSDLEVLLAEEGMDVVPNKVYLIPNTKFMGINNGRLVMSEKDGNQLPHFTIDAFFNSLARERGNKAIGVVLSGVGSDGSRGAMAIENAGGVMMVQDPLNAQFDGMPNAAIATSNTSYILPADELPLAIQHYVHEGDDEIPEPDAPVSEAFLNHILNLIRTKFPFDFTDYKLPTLQRRINRRMFQQKIADENQYLTFLQENSEEIEILISDFLIGVTSFFRDTEAFRIMETEVIPQLIDNKKGNEFLKLWVACCATGEEAYSLAILIREYLEKTGIVLDVKIFATDINRNALEQAGRGIFTSIIEKSVSEERLARFFNKEEDKYKISPEIRKMLIFARHDITRNAPYFNVDLISCRNMLIYIKPVLQKHVLSKLAFGLKLGGYLFLGSSENSALIKEDFHEVSSKWKIYQSIKVRRRINLENSLALPLTELPVHSSVTSLPTGKPPALHPALLPGMTEVILSETGLCGVTVDEEANVLQDFGDLSPFLKTERFNFNLRELLPENMAIAFSSSFLKVLKLNERVQLNNIEYLDPDSNVRRLADLIIAPYTDRKSRKRGMMVLFKIVGEKEATPNPGTDFNISKQAKAHIDQLERDLYHTKQELTTSLVNLESSKEAMQGYNEELLSANEEMQSANEELQSINEELETINNEHKNTIGELLSLNDDLNNYFRSNINGQLFVDKDILLQKYSPGATKHINLRESDIGRPLSNISTNIKFETLINDIKTVMSNGKIIIQEVESNDGKIYQVMTSPYLREKDQEVYGAIISFYDISELKKTQRELDKTNKMLGLAMIAAEIASWSINIETRELTSSPRLKEMLGFPADEELSYHAFLIQVVPDQQTSFATAVKASLEDGDKFEQEFSIRNFQDGKICWVSAVGNITYTAENKAEFLTGIMQDVTDHKLDDIRKNDFISIVSHELKTPLTSLKGYLQILQEQAQFTEDKFLPHALDRANKQVKKMTNLINGFLNVARLQTGKIYLNKEIFNIDDMIGEIVDEVAAVNPGYNIVLNAGCDLKVNADRDKISQVINNLFNNAIKYSPYGTDIIVSCSELPNNLQVSVKDQGPGVPIEEKEKIFDRFFRSENNKTKSISGFGIGLYLSSEIVQRHQGKIWVESEPEQGSTFCFTLPLQS